MNYRFGRFELRPAQRSLLADGAAAAIGARAFDVLLALVERRDRVVAADELFEAVWPGVVVEENNLRQQVAALRKLLGPSAIATVPGRGYRFVVPLEGATGARPVAGNLPAHLPALIGREGELASVIDLAGDAPVLTLLGAGGVGKTRLALAVAERIQDRFAQGAWLVELAPVADAALLTRVIASALDVHEEPNRPLLDTLLDYLRHAQLLVVLDNCEHLVEASARWVERMLQGSPGVRVLATSREPLGIASERVWRVLTLRAPGPDESPGPEALMAYAAAQLFVERARAADPAFRVTAGNAAAVARICHQLDGIPLALELAAARVKAMRVEQIADRLGDRFALLTRGSRTALERHQTLRSLVDWSHDLLSDPERVLLRRLSVFAGGWTLEAAEAACAGDGLAPGAVMELLAQLVEKSLVMLDDEAAEPRYRMLETIRQYGLEKLRACGEEEALRTRHLQGLVAFAEAISRHLGGEDQLLWQARAEAELDNIRVALDWAREAGHTQAGLRLLNALHRYWYRNMNWGEVADWQRGLAGRFEQQGLAPDEHYARSFYVAGMLATNLHPETGRALCERALAVSRVIGFDEGMAWALLWTAHIDLRQRDPANAARFAESLRVAGQVADPWRRATVLGNALVCYANFEAAMGRDEAAEAMLRECEAQIASVGNDAIYIGHCRALQATMATRRGDLERAAALVAESLALRRAVDSKFDVAAGLAQQGLLALRQGDPRRALDLFRESLPLYRNYPMSHWVTRSLAHLLIAYSACDRHATGAQLAGALAGPAGAIGAPPPALSERVAHAYEEAV
ncbi:MAG TPA: winged helix-turn-helix domain-containing protein, partial [Ramlibacter sp.]|nr:winged helix-turn-helix domain-containing protein [Ramlibacter sp.]